MTETKYGTAGIIFSIALFGIGLFCLRYVTPFTEETVGLQGSPSVLMQRGGTVRRASVTQRVFAAYIIPTSLSFNF